MSLGYFRGTLPWGLRETCFAPDACLLSWSLWPSHPTAAPRFGWGTGLAIPRKCLPPVQAGIPAHPPLERVCVVLWGGVGDGGMLPSLQVGEEIWGPPGGPPPSHLLAGGVPSAVPLPWPPPSPSLRRAMNQLSQLVKAGPLVFMPSPQETELQLFQLYSAGGQGPHFINISKPVRAEGTEMV